MRYHLDLGQDETVNSRAVAMDFISHGANRGDQLVVIRAGEATAFPGGRLADLASGELIENLRTTVSTRRQLRYHRSCPVI